jgi:hypothetical protein
MSNKERRLEQAYKELVKEGRVVVRAGEIAARADIDDLTWVGQKLSLGLSGFEDYVVEVVEHEDTSNEYRLKC